MKTIERLRQMKKKAVERMQHLSDLAAKEKRELSKDEQEEFDLEKVSAEALEADIKSLTETLATDANTPKPAVTAPVAAPAVPDADALRREADTQADGRHAARVASIKDRCTAAKLPDAFAIELIASGKSVEQCTAAIFEELSKNSKKPENQNRHSGASVNRDERDTFNSKMEAALTVRCNPKAPKETLDLGKEFAGLTMVEMAREYLEFAGVKTRGLPREAIARTALQGHMGAAEYFAGGMHTTSDFPNILANVANKTLRQAYQAAPRTFTAFARQVSAADFKPINRVQLSDVPTLTAVNEHGEFHRGSISDSKETYSLATYGEIIAITRKTIINDDLSALSRIPMGLGVAGAQLESDTVWGIITANAALSDSVNLFHGTHSNLNSGNALAADGLAAMRKAFRLQTGPKGTFLNLSPSFVLVPAALEQTLLNLVAPINLYIAQAVDGIPSWIRSLTPVVEPRLDANSATTWYAASDPAMIDTIEYCYLEGQEGVYTEVRQGFDVDGVEIKARLDFAAGAIDFRGLAKNTA